MLFSVIYYHFSSVCPWIEVIGTIPNKLPFILTFSQYWIYYYCLVFPVSGG